MAYAGRASTEEHAEYMAWLRREVMPLSGRVLAGGDELCGAISLHIRDIPLDAEELERDELFRMAATLSPVVILGFSASVNVDDAAAFRSLWVREGQRIPVMEGMAKRRMEESVSTLALALTIATAAQIHLEAPIFVPDVTDFTPAVHWSGLGRGSHIAREIGWPPLRTLPLEQVLSWLQALAGWSSGIGQGRVGRAVAALSQALATEHGADNALSLVWALVGLEALFCRQREGLRGQLANNAQLLLGRWQTHKRRFGQVYDFRSAFLHGGRDVPFAHRVRQDDHDAWRFIWDADEEAGLAMATLMSSIQELIIRGWHDLDFTTVIAVT